MEALIISESFTAPTLRVLARGRITSSCAREQSSNYSWPVLRLLEEMCTQNLLMRWAPCNACLLHQQVSGNQSHWCIQLDEFPVSRADMLIWV